MTPAQKKKKQEPIKKVPFKKVQNKPIFKEDFSKFDTDTGEKIAAGDLSLAKMEAVSEAKKARRDPHNKEETAKDAATGGSLSYLVGRTMGLKDSKRIKSLTSGRKNGMLGLAAAGVAGVMSAKKQKSEYNRQQASRELLSGKKTGRSSAYKDYLGQKYELQGK